MAEGIHGLHVGGKPMSQSEFEIVNGILDIFKIVIQAIMFFCGRRLSGRKNGARLVSLEISIDSEDYITTKCVGVLFFSGRGVKITRLCRK